MSIIDIVSIVLAVPKLQAAGWEEDRKTRKPLQILGGDHQ